MENFEQTLAYIQILRNLRTPDEAWGTQETFQTYDDTGGGGVHPCHKTASLCGMGGHLQEWNEHGGAIHLMLNPADGNGRSKDNVTKCIGVWADLDAKMATAPIDIEHLTLRPTMAVASSPAGRHIYWLFPEALEATMEMKQRIEEALAGIAHVLKDMGADPAVAEVARVLRVPGYLNNKPEHGGYVVTLLWNDGPRYSLEEIEAAFPPIRKAFSPILDAPRINEEDIAPVSRERRIDLATNWLERCTPGVKGDGGNAAYAACCKMYRCGLYQEDVYDLFMESFSPRCTMADGSPYPWSPEDAMRKVQECYKRVVVEEHAFGSDLLLESRVKVSSGKVDFIFFDRSASPDVQLPPGAESFQAKPNENPQPMPKSSGDFDEEVPGPEPEDTSSPAPTPRSDAVPCYDRNMIRSQLVMTKEGNPKSAGGNLVTIMSLDPEFLYQFKVNDMNQELYWKDHPLEAYHVSQIQQFLLYTYGVSFQVKDIEYEARSQGEKHRFNPARDYFRSLKWDGTSRFKQLATDVLHIEATVLYLAYLTKFLAAVVKRTEEPGCKFDNMLVLVGPQGRQKGRFWETLGGTWYGSPDNVVVNSVDAKMAFH